MPLYIDGSWRWGKKIRPSGLAHEGSPCTTVATIMCIINNTVLKHVPRMLPVIGALLYKTLQQKYKFHLIVRHNVLVQKVFCSVQQLTHTAETIVRCSNRRRGYWASQAMLPKGQRASNSTCLQPVEVLEVLIALQCVNESPPP